MSKKILVIGRNFHPDGKETATDIFEGLKGQIKDNDCTVDICYFKDLLFDISNQQVSVKNIKTGIELSDFDSVLMTNWFSHASIRKDIAHSLALYFDHNGVPCFNSEALHSRSTSKLSQMMIAALNGIDIPRTIFSLDFDELVAQAKQTFGLPYIFKDAQASRGNSNYLIKSEDQLVSIKSEHTEKHPFIAQQLINSDGSDYRFFIAGGKIRLVIKRIGQSDSHLTNTSAGADTELLKPEDMPAEVNATVEKASQLIRREVTGLDIMFDKDTKKSYFLEANPFPQIATGSNVEEKLSALLQALMESAK